MSPSFSRFFYKRLLARDFRVDEVVGLCETRDDLAQEMRNFGRPRIALELFADPKSFAGVRECRAM